MPQLPAPTNVRVCSDAGREATRLCIDFDLVTSATDYDVRIDGASIATGFTPGDFIDGLDPNTEYAIEARARASGFDDSEFSTPLLAVTRPPTPSAPSRVPLDLQGWGITLSWDEPGGWNGAAGAAVQLLRNDGAGSMMIFESPGLSGRFIDTHYPRPGLKAYRLRIAVGVNVSRESVPVEVRGAINAAISDAPVNAVTPAEAIAPLARSLVQIRRAGARLLGLRTPR